MSVTTDVKYTYDETWASNAKGRLTTATDASGTENYYYDQLGRTLKKVKTVNSDGVNYTHTVQTGYDALGRVTQVIYPDAAVAGYGYDSGGNLQQVLMQGVNFATYTGYNAAGKPGTITYGNKAVTDYTYYPETLRLKTIKTKGGQAYSLSSVPFNWVTANTATGITGDNQFKAISLPFSFPFYGTAYSSANVSSNGFISFDSGSTRYTPNPVPSRAAPNAQAAGLWRDLFPPAGCGGLPCITSGGSSSQFAVSYNSVKNIANSNRQTFQIVLNSDGSIVYQYDTVTNDVPTSIGIEDKAGLKGLAYSSPTNGKAIKFTPGQTVLQDIAYDYYPGGNVWHITDNLDPSRTREFKYDELDRLTEATSPADGTTTYQYDQIGNMTFNSKVGVYSYPTDGFLPHAVTQTVAHTGAMNTYDYDANGNMISRNGAVLTYDQDNRLTAVGTSKYVYDHAGQRVRKQTGPNVTAYIDQLYECMTWMKSCTKYVFAGGKRIARKNSGGVTYYHGDHLGSTSIVTDASGAKVEEVTYQPYGETISDTGSVNVKHKYTGQEEDSETGLYYYGARYYDPALGRFISADTIVPDFSNPQYLNRYAYVLNNPMRFTDPTGHYLDPYDEICTDDPDYAQSYDVSYSAVHPACGGDFSSSKFQKPGNAISICYRELTWKIARRGMIFLKPFIMILSKHISCRWQSCITFLLLLLGSGGSNDNYGLTSQLYPPVRIQLHHMTQVSRLCLWIHGGCLQQFYRHRRE